jgi:hypothetical protein
VLVLLLLAVEQAELGGARQVVDEPGCSRSHSS